MSNERQCGVIEARARNMGISILINDVPVMELMNDRIDEPGWRMDRDTLEVDEWLCSGASNTMTVLIKSFCSDRWQTDDDGEPLPQHMDVRLNVYPQGAQIGTDAHRSLARSEYLGPSDLVETLGVRDALLHEHFHFDGGLPRWAWFDAEVVDLSEAVYAEVYDLLVPVREALAAGDPEPWFELARIRYDERALCAGQEADGLRQTTRTTIRGMQAEGSWALEELTPDGLMLYPRGEGRLIQVCHIDKWLRPRPALRTTGTSKLGIFALPCYLAKIDGAWRIVR